MEARPWTAQRPVALAEARRQEAQVQLEAQEAKVEARWLMPPAQVRLLRPSPREGPAEEVLEAYEDLIEDSGKPKGLVLDLRNNPGGLLLEAVRLADLMIDDGVLVSIEGRAGVKGAEVFRARASATEMRPARRAVRTRAVAVPTVCEQGKNN